MKKTLMTALVLGVFAAAAVSAHEGHKHATKTSAPAKATATKAAAKATPKLDMKVQEVQLVGELVDPQCWFTHDGQGADHRDCAVMCAEGGQDLALYEDKTGRLYPIISASHGGSPNKGLIEHVATPVRISGTLYSRGANHALLVQNIQRVGAAK